MGRLNLLPLGRLKEGLYTLIESSLSVIGADTLLLLTDQKPRLMQPMKSLKCLLGLAAGLFLLLGCAGTPAPRDAAGNILYQGTGKARVYVYSTATLATDTVVKLDGAKIGTAKSRAYFLADTTPGVHSLVTEPAGDAPLSFHLDIGDNGYVRLDVADGRVVPLFVNDAIGEKEVATLRP